VTGDQDFLIDGRHGERITRVEVSTAGAGGGVIRGPPEGRVLSSIKVFFLSLFARKPCSRRD
jgi:hypothetical protein